MSKHKFTQETPTTQETDPISDYISKHNAQIKNTHNHSTMIHGLCANYSSVGMVA